MIKVYGKTVHWFLEGLIIVAIMFGLQYAISLHHRQKFIGEWILSAKVVCVESPPLKKKCYKPIEQIE